MPITRERKEELVAQYTELLDESNGFVVVSAKGMSVSQTESLRKKIYEVGGEYVVAKNTLIRIALEQKGWIVPTEQLQGPTAIVFGKQNFPGVAKAVLDFIKDAAVDEKVQIKGGIMAGEAKPLNAAGITAVSELPTLPELQAQIIGLIVAPSRSLVTILQNAESGVVNVLQAWLDKDKDGAA